MRFISLVALVLYFDGSLRYPTDPRFPTEMQDPRSACAAACIVDDPSNASKIQVLFLGGNFLRCSSQMTSGEVEYQGLLLGLEGLSTYLRQIDTKLRSDSTRNCTQITVRGDCKAVVQQMKGLARPRKLEPFYDRARDMIDSITVEAPIKFQFDHIPRSKNQLCDRLAVWIIKEHERLEYVKAAKQLQELCRQEIVSVSSHGDEVFGFMGEHLTMQSSTITYSKRTPFYRYLAKLCFQSSDFSALIAVGKSWERELERVWSWKACSESEQKRRQELLIEAIVYQMVGLRYYPRKTREFAEIKRKKRFMLERWKQLCIEVENQLEKDYSVVIEELYDFVPESLCLSKDSDEIAHHVRQWHAGAQATSAWGESNCVHWLNLSVP